MNKNIQSFIDTVLTAFVSFGVNREWDIRMGPGGIEARNLAAKRYEWIRATPFGEGVEVRGETARGISFNVRLGCNFGSLVSEVTSDVSWPSIGSVEPMDAASFASEITKLALLARVTAKALGKYAGASPESARADGATFKEAFAHMAAHEEQTASAICD